jgi:hypothetical protein
LVLHPDPLFIVYEPLAASRKAPGRLFELTALPIPLALVGTDAIAYDVPRPVLFFHDEKAFGSVLLIGELGVVINSEVFSRGTTTKSRGEVQ